MSRNVRIAVVIAVVLALGGGYYLAHDSRAEAQRQTMSRIDTFGLTVDTKNLPIQRFDAF